MVADWLAHKTCAEYIAHIFSKEFQSRNFARIFIVSFLMFIDFKEFRDKFINIGFEFSFISDTNECFLFKDLKEKLLKLDWNKT